LLSVKADTPDDEAFIQAGIARCEEMQFKADLMFQEAQGLIVVYTGRAKPKWA